MVQNKFGLEILLVNKKFGSEIFLGKKNLGWKNYWVKKKIGRNKILVQNKFGLEFFFGKKNLGRKLCWLKKKLGLNFFWVNKCPKCLGRIFCLAKFYFVLVRFVCVMLLITAKLNNNNTEFDWVEVVG